MPTDLFYRAKYAKGDSELSNVARRGAKWFEQGRDVMDTAKALRNWYDGKTRWCVTVKEGDRLYDVALKWLINDDVSPKPPRNIKAVYSSRSRLRNVDPEDFGLSTGSGGPAKGAVAVYYDEKTQRTVSIKGHKVTVQVYRYEAPQGVQDGSYKAATPDQLCFYARSYEGQQAVVRLLEEIANDTDKRKPALHMLSQWGDWMKRDDLPARQLDSVVLHSGQMERIRDDIQGFLNDEPHYVRRAIPYHRGYMLHGPPGTGKTSIVRAMAAHFGLDLWYAALGDLQKDASLIALINQVRPGSILLLEDMDVFHATRDRDDDSGLSMAGLLNALDGVATPHGLITFMTTNDIDVIDPAVLRPGRVDLMEEIGMPDGDQIRRLYNFWYDARLDESWNERILFRGSPASVTELFKQNLKNGVPALEVLQQAAPVVEKRSVTVTPIEGKRNERTGRVRQVEGR